MRKILTVIIVICAVFASFDASAGQEKLGSFYIGPFVLNQANWTGQMDNQLFGVMQNIPDEASLEVNGYTDNSGPLAFNEKLAGKRAELVAGKINKLRPEVSISAVTGLVYQAGANDIDYRMVKIDVYVSNEWLVSNRELASQLKAGFAQLKQETDKLKQSFQRLEALGLKTHNEVKDIKQALKSSNNGYKTITGELERARGLGEIVLYVALGIFLLLLLAYFMVRRNQKKSTIQIEKTINNLVIKFRRVKVENETKIYIVRAEQRQDRRWYSPFKSINGNEIYRSKWEDIKKSIKGSVKSSNENFREQKEKLIDEGIIKVKEKETG